MLDQGSNNSLRRWSVYFFWIAAAFAGFIYAWWCRHLMNSDGVCYLDISDFFLSGQWFKGVSPYWSPLYPLILAFLRKIIGAQVYWEFTIAHVANYILLLASLGAFHFFISEFLKQINDKETFRKTFILISGYSMFLWTTLEWTGLHFITPDLGVAAFLYLSMGLYLKLFRAQNPTVTAITFGIVLGLGYWMKTVLFVVALIFVIFLSLHFIVKKEYVRFKTALLPLLIPFVLISACLIVPISLKKEKLSYGESGKMTYLVDVQNRSQSAYWDTFLYTEENLSLAKNAPERLHRNPNVVYFGEDIKGTYPFAFDYSHWLDGLKIKVNVRNIIDIVAQNGMKLHELFGANLLFICSAMLILLLLYFRSFGAEFIRNYKVWLIPFLVLLMYMTVRVEGRYVGALVCLILTGIFGSFPFTDGARQHKLHTALLLALIVPLLTSVASHTFSWMRSMDKAPVHRYNYIAQELRKRWDIRPGDKVAFIGHSFEQNWARVGRLQIVAEIPLSGKKSFLKASDDEKETMLDQFKKTPAKAVVVENNSPHPLDGQWARISGTNYWIYSLE